MPILLLLNLLLSGWVLLDILEKENLRRITFFGTDDLLMPTYRCLFFRLVEELVNEIILRKFQNIPPNFSSVRTFWNWRTKDLGFDLPTIIWYNLLWRNVLLFLCTHHYDEYQNLNQSIRSIMIG